MRGIGFTFVGGAYSGKAGFHDATRREFIAEHVGEDNIRDGTVERVR